MVPITKDEKMALMKQFPHKTYPRTMKQDSKRGHYYCVEEPRLMRALREYRKSRVIETHTAKRR